MDKIRQPLRLSHGLALGLALLLALAGLFAASSQPFGPRAALADSPGGFPTDTPTLTPTPTNTPVPTATFTPTPTSTLIILPTQEAMLQVADEEGVSVLALEPAGEAKGLTSDQLGSSQASSGLPIWALFLIGLAIGLLLLSLAWLGYGIFKRTRRSP